MAIVESFTISQSALTPAVITAVDTSTGSYDTITARKISFQNSQGNYLNTGGAISTTPVYIDWPLANTTQSFSVLTEDQALAITVFWVNAGGATVNELTQLYCLSRFNRNFFYYLIQMQGLTPGILQDSTYFSAISTYWMNIIGAINAVEDGADIAASQNCLNRATYMMNNQTLYF